MGATLRKTVVTPLGLVVTPNEFGQYPEGAMSEARNMVMRAPGTLTAAPTSVSGTGQGAAGAFIRKMMALDAGFFYSFIEDPTLGWYARVITSIIDMPTGVSMFTAGLFTAGRICPIRARERMLVNSTKGVMVGDYMAPANAAERALRMAGLPQPNLSAASLNTSATGPIPPTILVGYSAIFVREFSDGYIIRSTPSPITKSGYDAANTLTVQLTVFWSASSGIVSGDYLEVYRTDGIVATSDRDDPGTTLKLILRQQLTATLGVAGSVTFNDQQLLVAPYYQTPGRELYTNPGQEGSTAANRQPDINGAQAVFRGFSFYGNLTERAQWSFSIPAGFGNDAGGIYLYSPYLRANGIGQRTGAGTITLGSPTITAIAAADLVGVVVGQYVGGPGGAIPFGTRVTAVGATTITCSANAVAGAATFYTRDVLELNGVEFDIYVPDAFRASLGRVGLFEVTVNQSTNQSSTPGLTFTVEWARPSFGTTFTVRGTNGQNYSQPIPILSAAVQTISPRTTKNLMRWSKTSEPEHVPAVNETRVGTGTIIQFVSTKDALWIFCTDGVYRLSGADGNWNIDIIDPKCVLCAPQCATELLGQVYAYTSQGLVQVTDAGIVQVSHQVVRELLPGQPFSELGDMIVQGNDSNREVLISLGRSSNILYIYNTQQNAWTRISGAGTAFDAMTAIAFNSYPSATITVPGVIMFGVSPAAGPAYSYWNGTAGLAMYGQWQPLYGKDPMLLKQWVDMTYLFDVADAGKSLVTTFGNAAVANGTVTLAAPTAAAAAGAVGTVGMHRNYAIAAAIQPEFAIAASGTQASLRSMSARYVPLTEQQGLR